MTENQRAMLVKPAPSHSGPGITVEYYLEIYHKHDKWNEFGDGTPIKIPIKIRNGQTEMPMEAFQALEKPI